MSGRVGEVRDFGIGRKDRHGRQHSFALLPGWRAAGSMRGGVSRSPRRFIPPAPAGGRRADLPMWLHLSQRILTLLQLTRMALVFTAIADGLCTVLLAAQRR